MTAPVVAQYPKDAPRGTGATGGEFVPQGTTPAKTQPKAAPAAKPKPKPAQKKPAAKPAGPGKPGSARLNLKVGGNNDPAEVRNLQQLLKDLQLGNLAVDGQFGSDTQAAVKAAQTKLGMKPTGRASSAFIKRLADAHALSPCIKKVSAAAVVDELEDEDDEQDPELVMASTAAGLGLSLWSDSTIWVADAEGETMELDLDDADRVVAGLRLLPDDREPGSYEVTDRLTLQVAEDLSTSLVAEEEDDAIELRLADLNEFADQLAAMFEPAPVAAAAGADVTPGHDELHHYWTRGEGLAKWADSPTPWTTLVALLTPHVGPEKAKTYASRWFIEVKGYAAGSDRNRVEHGHAPRGNNVGPG